MCTGKLMLLPHPNCVLEKGESAFKVILLAFEVALQLPRQLTPCHQPLLVRNLWYPCLLARWLVRCTPSYYPARLNCRLVVGARRRKIRPSKQNSIYKGYLLSRGGQANLSLLTVGVF